MPERRLGLIDISNRSQSPVIQWIDGPLVMPQWRVWTAYKHDLSLGTYIRLGDGGSMMRVTIYPDFTEALQPL